MTATSGRASGSVWLPGTTANADGRRAFPRPAQPGRNQGVPARGRHPKRGRGGEGPGRGSPGDRMNGGGAR